MHAKVGAWFALNGLVDEALNHLLAASDVEAAAEVVAQRRYALMNQAEWPRLEQCLRAFSPDAVNQSPELLLLKPWLLYQRSRYAELPAEIESIEAALARTTVAPGVVECLQGEISALRSLTSFLASDAQATLAHSRQSLAEIPRE
jgi:ATP/maltotriose-dependent transcriptional regulator MalT